MLNFNLFDDKLTLARIKPIVDKSPGYFAWKNTNYEYMGGNPAFNLLVSCKNSNEYIGLTDYELKINCNHDYISHYREHDEFVLSGKIWAGLEPANWNGCEIISSSLKLPLYDEDDNIIGIFLYCAAINQAMTLENLVALQNYDKRFNGHTKKSYAIDFGNNSAFLTRREQEVLFYTIRGFSAKEVGRALTVGYKAIQDYLENIKFKMDCKNKFQLVAKAILENYHLRIPVSLIKKTIQ